jgi:hypothetical protein
MRFDVVRSELGDNSESGGMLLEEDKGDGVDVMEVNEAEQLVLLNETQARRDSCQFARSERSGLQRRKGKRSRDVLDRSCSRKASPFAGRTIASSSSVKEGKSEQDVISTSSEKGFELIRSVGLLSSPRHSSAIQRTLNTSRP